RSGEDRQEANEKKIGPQLAGVGMAEEETEVPPLPPCLRCNVAYRLVGIEGTEKAHHDLYTFERPACGDMQPRDVRAQTAALRPTTSTACGPVLRTRSRRAPSPRSRSRPRRGREQDGSGDDRGAAGAGGTTHCIEQASHSASA